jgi:ornithine cyclodeaminase
MALIGNGAQSEFQALAFHHLLGIEEIHLYDTVARELRVSAYTSTREAVHGVDIITTVTADKTNAAILTADMIEPGMHINGVGGDCPGKTEIPPRCYAWPASSSSSSHKPASKAIYSTCLLISQ